MNKAGTPKKIKSLFTLIQCIIYVFLTVQLKQFYLSYAANLIVFGLKWGLKHIKNNADTMDFFWHPKHETFTVQLRIWLIYVEFK